MNSRVFLLSPANANGIRAGYLLREGAAFDLALRLGRREATLGEVFAFCSGLYFRGKLAYANRFSAKMRRRSGAYVITPSRGLVPPEELVDRSDLREFAKVPVDPRDERYARPLTASLGMFKRDPSMEAVLLGSVATGKYAEILLPILGERLLFPLDFVGRGDMSRGGLLLRAAASGKELPYVPVAGAVRRGRRPPKLTPVGEDRMRDATNR